MPTRIWAAAVAVLVGAAAVVAAVLFIPASDAQGQPIARVRALTHLGHGQDVFRRGALPAEARVVLDNGLLQARLGKRMLALSPLTFDALAPVLLPLAPPTRIARQVITYRAADIISIEGRDAADRPVVKLALRRGIPGAFVELSPGYSLRTSRPGAVLGGPHLGSSTFPTQGPVRTTRLRGSSRAALVPSSTRTITAILPDRTGTDSGTRSHRFLIGMLPRPVRKADAPIAQGDYMLITPGPEAQTRIVRAAEIPRGDKRLVVPYLLDDRERSGLRELLGFNAAYGRRLGPLP